MKRIVSAASFALLAALLLVVSVSTVALAHEKRHVGKYTFVVGFLNEPAYAQQQNALDLTICNGDACNYVVKDGARVVSNPVNDAEKTLKAEVIQGSSAPLALTLEPRWANPGKYSGNILPTATGTYIYHIYGTLDGNKIDERFTSGPNTFGDVNQLQAYPATTAQTSNASTAVTTLKAQIQDAQSSVDTARTFGIAGSVLGLLGLIAAGVALARKPKVTASLAATFSKKETADSLRG